jgi:hypothetical protein
MTGKLGMELDTSKSHPVFTLRREGVVIARTHISHGSSKDVSDGVVSAMARQLGITGPEFRDSLSCRIDGATFESLVRVSAETD